MTKSGKTGLIAYLKVSINVGFKYLVCCSSPMVEAMCTKISDVPKFTPIPYLPEHPLCKPTTKFPAILDSSKAKVDCIRQAAKGVGGGGLKGRQRWCSKIKKESLGMN